QCKLHMRYQYYLQQTSQRFLKKRAKSCLKIEGEDKISALPDDLLVHILSFVPTKHAMATMILSKRWRYIWTMLPNLTYLDKYTHIGGLFVKSDQQKQPIWRYIDESLQLHKAPVLETLVIGIGPQCPCPVDLDVYVERWIATAVDRKVRQLGIKLMWSAGPASVCKSLYTCDTLVLLSLCDKILVDVPSSACLPSLKTLNLISVVYKDEDSLVTWCNTFNFSHLMECTIGLLYELDWLESLMGFLQNSPNLKNLYIDQKFIRLAEDFSLSWNEPGSVPGCLSTHLEIFEWEGYIGRREEKEAIRYIFANAKCLKRAGISVEPACKLKDKEKMMRELESMSRVSTSSQLLFTTQVRYLRNLSIENDRYE
ncbi:hypothetical protein EUTSA_v10029383mg, partial [Eutrema salsugineum]